MRGKESGRMYVCAECTGNVIADIVAHGDNGHRYCLSYVL